MIKFLRNENGFVEHSEWQPYCWVNVECPDADDVRMLLDDFGMPAEFLDSVADIDERPRAERNGAWKLIILRVPVRSKEGRTPFITVPIGIVTNNEIVVTICYHYTELIPDFINHTRRKGITITSEADFILRLIYSSTYWFLTYLKEINRTIAASETQLERSVRNEDLLRLMMQQNTLVYFNTSIQGNEVLLGRVRHIYNQSYDADLLEDVEIELSQASNTVKIYTQILAGMLDSFESIISNNVNDIMKKMTGISIVLMIPTLVASFYGMNVEISYGNHAWVLPAIVCASLCLSGIVYWLLRRFRWL